MDAKKFASPPTKVIGIGLNKTGTTTLAECFRLLGYKNHVSCRPDLLALYKNGNLAPIYEIIEHNETFEDWPFPLIYREIFFKFGSCARYILTKRQNAITWLTSLKKRM